MRSLLRTKQIRVASLFTALIFSFNSVAWGGAPLGHISISRPLSLSKGEGIEACLPAGRVRVPPQYGWLKDQFQSPFPATPEHPYLIHLEDAHADPVAQKNMAEVLDTLAREQKIDLVFVEAAIGSLDAKYLAFTGDAPLDRKIAAKLAEMGQMTAADLYLLEHGNAPLEFVGIENPDLYREEIRCLREVLGHEAEIKAWASQQGRVLDRKISRETGKDLASLLNFYLHLEQENGRVLQQLPSLNQQSRRLLGRDLTAFLEQRHFPALFRLLRLQKEKAVDMEKAKREWKQIQRMAYGVQRTALNKITENIEGWFFHRTPYSVRRTLGNPRFVLEKLYVSLQPKGFRFEQYPNFTRYARNLTLQYELRDANLFKELNQWLAQLITAAAKTDAEKALVHEVREAKLVHKLALLELTREEWEEIQSSVVGRESSVGLLTTDDPRLTTAFQFYRLVERRDQAFIENIRRELTARKKFRAVVIAGGFHTAAFTDFARKSDSSYTVIAPRAGSPSRQHYVNAILARHPEPAAASGAALIAQAISDPQLVRLGESPSFRAAQRRALGASLGGRTNERRPARAGVNRSRATLRKGNGDDFKRGLLSAEEKEYQEWLQKEWGRTGIAAAATLRDAMIERLIRATEPIVDEWQQSGWLEAQEAEAVMARSQFQGAAVLFRRIWEWKAVYEARGVEEGVIQSCFSLLIDPGQYQKGEELFGVSGIKLINYLRRANSQRKLKVAEEILQENKEGNRIFNASQAVAIATSRDAEAAKSAALELVKVEVNGKTVFNASQAVKIAISRDAEAARRVAQDMISERAANGQLLLSPAAISVIAAASKEIRTELQREALRAARAGQSVWPVIQGRTNISEAMADQDMPVEATEDGAEAQAESLGESPSFRAAQRRALAGSLGTPLDSTDPNLLGRLALYYSYLNQYNALNTKLAGVRGLRQIAIDHPERASEVMRRLFDAFGDSMEEMKRAAMEAVAKIGRTHQAAALEAMGYLFDRLSRNLLIPPNGQHNGSLVATAHPAHHVPAIEGTGIVIELAIAQPHTAATAVEYYADWLTHGNDIVRANGVHAIRVMSRLGAPNGEVARAAMRHLSSRFTDRDPWVRLAAVEGISEIGFAHRDLALEAMQYLFPMLWNEYQEHHGEHQYVRNGAAIGIDRLFMLTPDLTEQVRSLVLGLIATQDDLAKVNDDETRLIVRCIKKDPKIVNDEMKRRILALLDEDVNSDFVSAACDALFDVDSSFVTEAYLLRYLDYVAREPERVHKPATLRMPRPTTELLKKMALKRPNVFTGEVLAEWLKRTPTRNSEDLYWQKPEIIRIFNSVAPVLEDDAVMEELMQSEKTNQVFRQCWAAPGHDHRHTPAPLPITAVSVKKAGEYLAHKDPEVRRRAVEFLGVAAKRPETYTLFTPDNLKLLAERMRAHREEFQDTPLWKAYGAFFENFLDAEKMGRSFLAELLQRLVLVPFSIMADIAVVFREAKERERERRRQERNKPLTGPKGELRLQALAGDQGLFEVGRIAPILTEDILKRISSRPVLMTELSAQELLRRVAKVREMVEAAGLDLSPDELVFAADRVCLDEKNPETIYLDPLDKELNLAVRTPREETYARLRTRLEAMKADESDPASDLAGLGKLKAASASKRWGIENDASIMEQALRLTRLAGEERFETDEGLAAEIVEMAKAEVTREAVPFRVRWKSIRASGILDDDTFTEALELETDLATAQDPVSLDARINNIRLVLEEGKRAGKELEPEAVLEGASLIGNGDTVNERAKRSKLRRMWKVEKAGEMGETWKGKFAAWFRKTVEPAGMLTGLLHGESRPLWPEESVDEASPIVPAPSIILDQELTGTVEEAFFPDATDMEADVRIWGHTLVGIKESAGKYFLVYYFDGAEAAGRPEYIFLDHFRDLADLNPVNLIQDSAAIEALLPELRRQKGEEAPQEVAPPSAPGGAAPSETRAPPEGAQAGDISAASASLESPTPANNRPAPAPAPAVPSAMSQPDELVAPGEVFEAESLGAQLDRVEVVGEEKIAQKTRDELKQHFQSSNVYDGIQRVIASRAGTQVILTFINERSEEATLSIELMAKSGWPAVVAEIDTKFAQAKESGQFKKPGAKKRIATWSYLLPLIGVAIIVVLFLISGPKEKVEIPVLKPPPPVQKVVQPQIQEVTREWILATYPIIPPQPISEAEKAHAALRPDQMTASQLKEAATYEKAVNVLKQIKEKEGVLNWFGRIRRENVQFGNKMLVPAEVERIIWNDVVRKGYVSGQSLGRKSKKEKDKLRTKRKVKAHLASDEEEAASQPKQTDSDPIKREGIFQYKRLLSVVAILPLVFIVGVIFVFVRKKQLRKPSSPVVTQKEPAVKEPAAQNNLSYPDLTGHHRILLWQHGDEVADLDAAIPYVQEMIQESGRDARGRPQMAYILEYVCNMVEILDRYAKQYPERAAWFSYQDNGHVDEVALAKESEKLAGLLQDPDLVPIYNQFVDERAFAIETGFYEENPDVLKYAHRLGPRGVQTFQFILKNRFYVQVERTPFRSWATLMYFILNLNRRDTGNDFFTLARHARASNIFYFRGLWGRDRKMNSDLASALRTHKAPSLNSVYLVGYDHDPALIFKNYPHTSFRNIHQGGTALELKRRFGPFEDPSDGSLPNFNAEYDWLFHQDISPEESELLAQFLFEQDFRGAQTSARTAEEIFFRFLAKMKERKLSAMMLLNRYLAQLARDQQSALESFGMPLNRRDYILNALKRDGLLTAEEFAAIAQQNPAAYGHSLGVWVDWAASFWKARRRTILWMTLPLVMLASILAWSLFGSRPPPAPAASAPAASTSAYYYVPLNTTEDVIRHLTGLARLLPPEANQGSIHEYISLLANPAVGHVDLADIAPEDLFAPGNEQYAMEAGILGTRTDAEGKASWIHYYANKLRLFPPEFLAGILWHEAQHLEDYRLMREIIRLTDAFNAEVGKIKTALGGRDPKFSDLYRNEKIRALIKRYWIFRIHGEYRGNARHIRLIHNAVGKAGGIDAYLADKNLHPAIAAATRDEYNAYQRNFIRPDGTLIEPHLKDWLFVAYAPREGTIGEFMLFMGSRTHPGAAFKDPTGQPHVRPESGAFNFLWEDRAQVAEAEAIAEGRPVHAEATGESLGQGNAVNDSRLRARDIARLFRGEDGESAWVMHGKDGKEYRLSGEAIEETQYVMHRDGDQFLLKPGVDVIKILVRGSDDRSLGEFIGNLRFYEGRNYLSNFRVNLEPEVQRLGIASHVYQRMGTAFPDEMTLAGVPVNLETLAELVQSTAPPELRSRLSIETFRARAEAELPLAQFPLGPKRDQAIRIAVQQAFMLLISDDFRRDYRFGFDSATIARTVLGKLSAKAGFTYHEIKPIGDEGGGFLLLSHKSSKARAVSAPDRQRSDPVERLRAITHVQSGEAAFTGPSFASEIARQHGPQALKNLIRIALDVSSESKSVATQDRAFQNAALDLVLAEEGKVLKNILRVLGHADIQLSDLTSIKVYFSFPRAPEQFQKLLLFNDVLMAFVLERREGDPIVFIHEINLKIGRNDHPGLSIQDQYIDQHLLEGHEGIIDGRKWRFVSEPFWLTDGAIVRYGLLEGTNQIKRILLKGYHYGQYRQAEELHGAVNRARDRLFQRILWRPLADPLTETDRIFDAAIGRGRELKSAPQSLIEKITGADFMQAPLDQLNTAYPTLQTVRCDLAHVPLPDASFARVIGLNAISYISEDEMDAVIREMDRLLKPGAGGAKEMLFIVDVAPEETKFNSSIISSTHFFKDEAEQLEHKAAFVERWKNAVQEKFRAQGYDVSIELEREIFTGPPTNLHADDLPRINSFEHGMNRFIWSHDPRVPEGQVKEIVEVLVVRAVKKVQANSLGLDFNTADRVVLGKQSKFGDILRQFFDSDGGSPLTPLIQNWQAEGRAAEGIFPVALRAMNGAFGAKDAVLLGELLNQIPDIGERDAALAAACAGVPGAGRLVTIEALLQTCKRRDRFAMLA